MSDPNEDDLDEDDGDEDADGGGKRSRVAKEGGGKRRVGRPRGGKGKYQGIDMRTKRFTDASLRDTQIANQKVLVILPKKTLFPVAVEADPGPVAQKRNEHVPVGGAHEPHYEGVIRDFLLSGILSLYDTLELHCFLSPSVSVKMESIYLSDDMKITNITTEDYRNVIASQNLVKFVDDRVEMGGIFELPAAQYAVAAFYRRNMTVVGEDSREVPVIHFVTQDSFLRCFLFDSHRLAQFLTSNFGIILEAHDRRIFDENYLVSDGVPIFERYWEWLSVLVMKSHIKVYPPVSHAWLFENVSLRDRLLRGHRLHNCYVKLPAIISVRNSNSPANVLATRNVDWQDVTWNELQESLYSLLHQSNTNDHSTMKVKSLLALKPLLHQRNPEECLFITLDEDEDDEENTDYFPFNIKGKSVYTEPGDWLPPDKPPRVYQIECYDEAYREQGYTFVFYCNDKGDLEKMYMMATYYDGDGVPMKNHTIHKDYENIHDSDFKYFNRTILGYPNQLKKSIMEQSNGRYPAILTGMLYSVTVAHSSIRQVGDTPKPYVTSINLAYSHGLLLTNDVDDDIKIAFLVADKVGKFIRYHWNNYPK